VPSASPTPSRVELIQQLIEFAGDIDAIVLDPFAGSGTTGDAVLQLNARDGGARRFIMIEEGTKEDRYCRTLTAPRIRAAIDQDGFQAGFLFEAMGRRLNRDAILELEREAIANLIVQTDATGKGQGITKIAGALHHRAQPAAGGDLPVLERPPRQHRDPRDPREDVRGGSSLDLRRPLRVYGFDVRCRRDRLVPVSARSPMRSSLRCSSTKEETSRPS